MVTYEAFNGGMTIGSLGLLIYLCAVNPNSGLNRPIRKDAVVISQEISEPRSSEDELEAKVIRGLDEIYSQPTILFEEELPPRMQKWYDEYTKNDLMIKRIEQTEERYGELLETASSKYNIPYDLLLGMVLVESGGNAKKTSRKGAKGLLQIMPGTGKFIASLSDLKCTDLYQPNVNIACGAFYLSWINQNMNESFPNLSNQEQWDLTLAAYNRGHNGIKRDLAKADVESFLELGDDETTPEAYDYVSKIRTIERIVQEQRKTKETVLHSEVAKA